MSFLSHIALCVIFFSLSTSFNKYCRWHDERLWINHPGPAEEEPKTQWPPLQQATVACWELTQPESRLCDNQSDSSPTANYFVSIAPADGTLGMDDGLSGSHTAERCNLKQQPCGKKSKKPRLMTQMGSMGREVNIGWDPHRWRRPSARVRQALARCQVYFSEKIWGGVCGSRVTTALGNAPSTANRSGEL